MATKKQNSKNKEGLNSNEILLDVKNLRVEFNMKNGIVRAVDDIRFVDEATGTAPLRALGYQRLFGFGATAVAIPYGTVEAAKALYNVSEDEMDALKRFVPQLGNF